MACAGAMVWGSVSAVARRAGFAAAVPASLAMSRRGSGVGGLVSVRTGAAAPVARLCGGAPRPCAALSRWPVPACPAALLSAGARSWRRRASVLGVPRGRAPCWGACGGLRRRARRPRDRQPTAKGELAAGLGRGRPGGRVEPGLAVLQVARRLCMQTQCFSVLDCSRCMRSSSAGRPGHVQSSKHATGMPPLGPLHEGWQC